MPKTHRFRIRLFKGSEAVNSSTFAAMGFDSVSAFGRKGRVAVMGKINGFEFKGKLMLYGGRHLLTVNKALQMGTNATTGMDVERARSWRGLQCGRACWDAAAALAGGFLLAWRLGLPQRVLGIQAAAQPE